jgi:hypothetical protein
VDTGESPPEREPFAEIPVTFSPPPAVAHPAQIDPANKGLDILFAFVSWIASVVFIVVLPFVTALPYLVSRASKGLPLGDSLVTDRDFIFYSVLGVVPAHLLTLLMAWAIITRFGRRPFWKTLGSHWPPRFGLWKSVAVALALLALAAAVNQFIGGPKTELEEMINSSYKTRVLTAILAATTGPLVEEIIYRGMLFGALQRAIGAVGSIVMVSVLFAAVHIPQYWSNGWVIAVICVLSITLTVVRAFGGSLLPPIVIHYVFNGIQSVLLVLGPFFEKPEQTLPEPIPATLAFALFRYFT